MLSPARPLIRALQVAAPENLGVAQPALTTVVLGAAVAAEAAVVVSVPTARAMPAVAARSIRILLRRSACGRGLPTMSSSPIGVWSGSGLAEWPGTSLGARQRCPAGPTTAQEISFLINPIWVRVK